MNHYLAVMDVETTHTDETAGSIIEVGCLIVTRDLDIVDLFEEVIVPQEAHRNPETWPLPIMQMHYDSGLLEECAQQGRHKIGQVDARLARLLEPYTDITTGKIPLAGSGVGHFDSRWIRRWMRRTNTLLTYWSYDVGVVRRFGRDLCGIDNPMDVVDDKPHRALDDARLHLDELVAWRDTLRKAR